MEKAIAYNLESNTVETVLIAADRAQLDRLIDSQGFDFDVIGLTFGADHGLRYAPDFETIKAEVTFDVDVRGEEEYRGISFWADAAVYELGRVISTTTNFDGKGTDKAIVAVPFDSADDFARTLRADTSVVSF